MAFWEASEMITSNKMSEIAIAPTSRRSTKRKIAKRNQYIAVPRMASSRGDIEKVKSSRIAWRDISKWPEEAAGESAAPQAAVPPSSNRHARAARVPLHLVHGHEACSLMCVIE